jgi:hypothetical protein
MPDSVPHGIGLELMRVQFGGEPKNFKLMPWFHEAVGRVERYVTVEVEKKARSCAAMKSP